MYESQTFHAAKDIVCVQVCNDIADKYNLPFTSNIYMSVIRTGLYIARLYFSPFLKI